MCGDRVHRRREIRIPTLMAATSREDFTHQQQGGQPGGRRGPALRRRDAGLDGPVTAHRPDPVHRRSPALPLSAARLLRARPGRRTAVRLDAVALQRLLPGGGGPAWRISPGPLAAVSPPAARSRVCHRAGAGLPDAVRRGLAVAAPVCGNGAGRLWGHGDDLFRVHPDARGASEHRGRDGAPALAAPRARRRRAAFRPFKAARHGSRARWPRLPCSRVRNY